jgi:transposase-like protein
MLRNTKPMALTAKQVKAVALLTTGKNAREVAKTVGVCPETISVWRRSAEFEALTNQFRVEVVESARDALRHSALEAVECLQLLMTGAQSEDVRRRAAMDVLNLMGLGGDPSGWRVGQVDATRIEAQRKSDQQINELVDEMLG